MNNEVLIRRAVSLAVVRGLDVAFLALAEVYSQFVKDSGVASFVPPALVVSRLKLRDPTDELHAATRFANALDPVEIHVALSAMLLFKGYSLGGAIRKPMLGETAAWLTRAMLLRYDAETVDVAGEYLRKVEDREV